MFRLLDATDTRKISLGQKWGVGDVTEVVSAMSQLLVMVRLGTDDPEFGKRLKKFATEEIYIKDLLDETIATLATKKFSRSDALIDPQDKCWSALPTDSVKEILRAFVESGEETSAIASFIIGTSTRGWRGLASTPVEVLQLMGGLLGDPSKLLLPTDSSAIGGIKLAREDQKVSIRMKNESTAKIINRLYFAIGTKMDLEIGDLYSDQVLDNAVSVLLIPEFSGKVSSDIEKRLPDELQGSGRLTSDEAALASVASRGAGKIVALVPASMLFRGGRSRQFRKWLIESAGLTTVIMLSQGLLDNTALTTAIVVLDPNNDADHFGENVLLFPGDTGKYVKERYRGKTYLDGWKSLLRDTLNPVPSYDEYLITKSKLEANDFVLQPSRYGAQDKSGLTDILKDFQVTTLGHVVEIISPLAVKPAKEGEVIECTEVRIGDFAIDGHVHDGSKRVQISRTEMSRLDRQFLRDGDILLGTKGSVGKCAILASEAPRNLVAGQTMVILRLKEYGSYMDSTVLIRYLSLPQVQEFLSSMAGGGVISFLKKKDLINLQVPILTTAQEQEIIEKDHEIQAHIGEAQYRLRLAKIEADEAFDGLVDAT